MNAERLFSITLVASFAVHVVIFAIEPDLFAMNKRRIVEIPIQLNEPPPPPKPIMPKPKPQKPPKRIVRPKVKPIPVPRKPKQVETPCNIQADVAERVVERPVANINPLPGNDNGTGSSAAEIKSIVKSYLHRLRTVVEHNKRYPNIARRNGIEGTVRLRFMILPDGKIDAIRVVTSSGVDMLDQAAIQALRSASGSVLPPKAIEGKSIRSSVKLTFELNQ